MVNIWIQVGVEFTVNHSNNPPAFVANVCYVSGPCETVGQSDFQIFIIHNLDEHLSFNNKKNNWNTWDGPSGEHNVAIFTGVQCKEIGSGS